MRAYAPLQSTKPPACKSCSSSTLFCSLNHQSPDFHYNTNTPSLTYQTNAVSPAPNQGKVTIFSPSCDTWGVVTLSTNNPTSILAWGLSIKHPVLFAPIYDPALRYATPKFEYAGKIYGSSTCDCHGDPSGVGHACVCQFDCVPFMLDSEAKAAIDM